MKSMYVCPIAFRRRAASLILLLCAAVAVAPLFASSRQSAPLEAAGGTIVNVSTEAQLQNAVASLTSDTTIVIAPGTYTLSRTLTIAGGLTNVVIRGATDNSDDVVLVGRGAGNADVGEVPNGISVGGGVQGIAIANLTIRDVYNHAILFAAGTGSPRIANVHLVDAGQGFIKAAADGAAFVDNGILEGSLIEATSPSLASGMEIQGGSRWTIRYNTFRNLQAPEGQLAAAVLVRGGARETVVEANTFVNCQQEIVLGSADGTPNDHTGGVVRNNFIARNAASAGAPAISIADSPGTQVLHNTVLTNGSGSPIELRFPDTTGVVVRNNLTDGEVASRDGAAGTVSDNYTTATAGLFADAASGDLHLAASATAVMDRVGVLAGAPDDWDGEARPQGGSADYGADEYSAAVAQGAATGLTSTTDAQATTPTTLASQPSSGATAAATAASTLPSPWATMDVGNATPAGSAAYDSGTFTLQGGGPSIGGSADQFRFAYQILDGDGEIVARVTDVERTHPWAKAGVMFRDELTEGSAHAFAFVAAGQGPGFEYRQSEGATSTQSTTGSRTLPAFLKLTRKGNTFTAFLSTNGTTWTQMGTQTISMNSQVYVGLAVSSRSTKSLSTGTFDAVSVTGSTTEPDPDPDPENQAPSVALTAPASGASFTAPTTVQLTATAADADGSIAQVDFYVGGTLVGSDTSSPYTASWNASTAGSYTLTAAARDNDGAWTTSAPVSVTVQTAQNKPPAVSLTAPSSGATFTAPANITLSATASDADGTVARVDFYAGSTLLGSDTTSPYSFTWSGVAAGTYSLTARATDNNGATSSSSPVSITVAAAPSLPRYVVFNASADHSTNVTSYTVEFFTAGSNTSTGTPVSTQSIGKPTPVNGEIQVDVAATIQALPAGTYVTTVKATGSGGSTRSTPSESFVR